MEVRKMSVNLCSIVASYQEGMSLRAIGAAHGVSHEWIRKIVRASGLSRLDGGQSKKELKNIRNRIDRETDRQNKLELRSRTVWDLSLQDFRDHVATYGGASVKGSPMCAFKYQRGNALRRGIKWDFTFSDWWQVWLESGKWECRGRNRENFVMARYGDGDVPYSRDTVYICTASSNIKDGFVFTPSRAKKKS